MPTYVYRCDTCSSQFELVQRFSDDPIKACPECIGMVRRVIHPVGVVFKGSGWYINDSRTSTSSAANDSPTATADGTKTDSKHESKSKRESTTEAAKTGADSAKTEKPIAKPAAD